MLLEARVWIARSKCSILTDSSSVRYRLAIRRDLAEEGSVSVSKYCSMSGVVGVLFLVLAVGSSLAELALALLNPGAISSGFRCRAVARYEKTGSRALCAMGRLESVARDVDEPTSPGSC